MGYLNTAKPPGKYDPSYFFKLVESIRSAFNKLDESNFEDKTIPLGKLSMGEWHLPLVGLASASTTTSTSFVNCSQFIHWNPASWPTGWHAYLDVTGGPISSGTAEFNLLGGSSSLVTISTDVLGLQWSRKEITSLPTVAQTLILQMRSTTGSSVGIMGAKIVIKP